MRVLPQLIETTDFRHFKISTLNGSCVQNKGMALFPRKVGGKFVMASRLDGENIYLLESDNIHFWNESKLVHGPKACLGVHAGGQLRLTDRDRGGMDPPHGRSRPDAPLLARPRRCSISRILRVSSGS